MAEVVYKVEEAAPQKKSISVVLIVFLGVLVALAGGTLAYLTTVTNTESNMFVAGNIKADLLEEKWVPEDAKFMLPGVVVDKDPLIKNTTPAEVDEWAGMLVSFQKPSGITDGSIEGWVNMSDAEVDALLLGVRVQSGSDEMTAGGFAPHANWGARIDTTTNVTAVVPGQRVYAFNNVIAKDASTDAIFDEVGILMDAGSGEWDGNLSNVSIDNFMTWLYADLDDGGLGGYFQIKVAGAAVQGDVERDEAVKAILKLFNYTLVPTP